MVSTDLSSEIWNELKRYVNTVDRQEAAETMVAVMIDNDCDVESIRESFKGDTDIKRALTAYVDNDKVYEEDDDVQEDTDEDEDDTWEN
jgi:hypothetical protein